MSTWEHYIHTKAPDRLGQLIILHAEHEARPTVCVDLGHGVPDTAILETTAYCPEVAEREGAV
jgi:hypothetical protein